MIANGMVPELVNRTVVALTPRDRWSAARGFSGRDPFTLVSEHWFYVAAGVALVVLLGLLWWVSRRNRAAPAVVNRELFSENALRRGLSSRERQILLAIVLRSGLGQTHDIFTTVDAFDRGAAKLLAECVRTRTPQEIESLKNEVAFLREKLGFQSLRTPGLSGARRPNSRDILVGKTVEVTRRRQRAGATIRARVVRNDDIELAVELETPVGSSVGDFWRVRYTYGMSVWEFDTTVVSCGEARLVLNHVDNVRFVNRRRFPRVAVTLPALVAVFPFVRRASHKGRQNLESSDDLVIPEAPAFVRATVAELAGPGLRIEAPLRVRTGDRVLVIFQPNDADATLGIRGQNARPYLVEDMGQIRHCRDIDGGMSFAVELTGVNEAHIDELVRITNVISARAGGFNENGKQEAVVIVSETAAVQGA